MPVIGPPIGYEPRNATADRARIRPCMSGGHSCWLIALNALTTPAPPMPSGTATSIASHGSPDHARAKLPAHISTAMPIIHRNDTHARLAVSNEPNRLPMLIDV